MAAGNLSVIQFPPNTRPDFNEHLELEEDCAAWHDMYPLYLYMFHQTTMVTQKEGQSGHVCVVSRIGTCRCSGKVHVYKRTLSPHRQTLRKLQETFLHWKYGHPCTMHGKERIHHLWLKMCVPELQQQILVTAGSAVFLLQARQNPFCFQFFVAAAFCHTFQVLNQSVWQMSSSQR